MFSDGSTNDRDPSDVTWTSPITVTPLPADSTDASPIPAFGAEPTAIFVDNTLRTDRNGDLPGVLFVLDPGTAGTGQVTATATIEGETASATIAVTAIPPGDPTRGATTYMTACSHCHGDTAAGSPVDANGTTYTIDGVALSYPAPGLDAEPGNLGSDPDWKPALLAMAARADLDNGGLVLRTPMIDWLATPMTDGGSVPSTQDFADIYAWLQNENK